MEEALLQTAVSSVGPIGARPMNRNEETGEIGVTGERSDGLVTNAHISLVGLLSLVGAMAGCSSFFLVQYFVADIASIFVVVLAACVGIQKLKLNELGGFRDQHNQLRLKVNTLARENLELRTSVNRLQKAATALQQVESTLREVARSSGLSVDRLVNIVSANGLIQKQILENLQAEVVQQILTATLQTDKNGDFILSPAGVETLILRLKNVPGVVLNEDEFRSFLSNDEGDLTLVDVCKIIRNLKEGTADQKSRVVTTPRGSVKPRGLAFFGQRDEIVVPKGHIFEFDPYQILEERKPKILGLRVG